MASKPKTTPPEDPTPGPGTTPGATPTADDASSAEAGTEAPAASHEATPSQKERIAALEAERDRLKQEVRDLRDKYLRARADYENLSKRATKETQTLIQTAKASLLLRWIETMETLEKAIGHLKTQDADVKGLQVLLDQVQKQLKDEGVRALPTEGIPFNYHHHLAVERTVTSEAQEGKILEVFQRGYTLDDHVLRPAMVRVAVAPPKAPRDDAEAATEDAT